MTFSWYGRCAEKISPTLLHFHQPEPLSKCRMEPCFCVVYTKFWPCHMSVSMKMKISFLFEWVEDAFCLVGSKNKYHIKYIETNKGVCVSVVNAIRLALQFWDSAVTRQILNYWATATVIPLISQEVVTDKLFQIRELNRWGLQPGCR